MVGELTRDPIDRGCRDDQRPSTWSAHRHAEGLAASIDRQSAFRPTAQPNIIHLDPRIDRTAAHRLPGRADGRDDTEGDQRRAFGRSEEHTSELQSLMRNSYAVFFLKKK